MYHKPKHPATTVLSVKKYRAVSQYFNYKIK